jgi:hypothetical protein
VGNGGGGAVPPAKFPTVSFVDFPIVPACTPQILHSIRSLLCSFSPLAKGTYERLLRGQSHKIIQLGFFSVKQPKKPTYIVKYFRKWLWFFDAFEYEKRARDKKNPWDWPIWAKNECLKMSFICTCNVASAALYTNIDRSFVYYMYGCILEHGARLLIGFKIVWKGRTKSSKFNAPKSTYPTLHVQLALFLKQFFDEACGVKSIFMAKINISMRVNFVTSIFKSLHYLGTIFRASEVLKTDLWQHKCMYTHIYRYIASETFVYIFW